MFEPTQGKTQNERCLTPANLSRLKPRPKIGIFGPPVEKFNGFLGQRPKFRPEFFKTSNLNREIEP